jgi:hypothetical protein
MSLDLGVSTTFDAHKRLLARTGTGSKTLPTCATSRPAALRSSWE